MNFDTLIFGGIDINICTWSIQALASMISTPYLFSARYTPHIAFRLYFGAKPHDIDIFTLYVLSFLCRFP